MNQVVNLVKSEVDRPLQVGDVVRGYAKYRNVDTIYFYKTTSGGVNSSSYTSTEPAISPTGYGSFNNTTSMGLKDAFNIIKAMSILTILKATVTLTIEEIQEATGMKLMVNGAVIC